jgi:hypothetical protein
MECHDARHLLTYMLNSVVLPGQVTAVIMVERVHIFLVVGVELLFSKQAGWVLVIQRRKMALSAFCV